jgi:DNA polymerase-3 subunit beta
MKESCCVEQKELIGVLTAMQPICSRRTTIETTESLLMTFSPHELVIKSTDLEINVQASITTTNNTLTQEQLMLIPGKRLYELVRELEGSITLELNGNHLTVMNATLRVVLNGQNPQDFPDFPERIENFMDIKALDLETLCNSTLFLVPSTHSHTALTGLLVEIDSQGITMTATDGHSLVQAKNHQYTLEKKKSWLIPRRSVMELKKIIENNHDEMLFLGTCGQNFVVSGARFNFFTKVLHDQFPDYQPIIAVGSDKQDEQTGIVKKTIFIKALRRCQTLLAGQFLATKFELKTDSIHISMQHSPVGTLEETCALTWPHESVDLNFYAPYLLAGLSIFQKEEITFLVQDSLKPIIFYETEQNQDLLYLVMPVCAVNKAGQA